MKKLIYFFLIPLSLFSDEQKLSYEQFDQEFNKNIALNLNLVKEFVADTGESKKNFDVYLDNAMHDENWKKGIYYFYFTKNKVEVKYGSKKYDRTMEVPDLNKGFEYFAKSTTISHNPLAAYAGLSMLTKLYMNVQGGEIPRKYMKTFSKELKDRNYCLGYMYYGRSHFKELSDTPDYRLAYDILKEGDEKCIKEGIPSYIPKFLQHQKLKAKTLHELKD